MKKLNKYLWIIVSVMFLLMFVFWGIGYFLNGFYGYHFELGSCWAGFGALGGAGGMTLIKYITDSCKNSKQGEMPKDGGDHDRGISIKL